MSMARMDAFTRGRILGLREAREEREDFVNRVKKKDGTRPSLRAVDNVLAKFQHEPTWRGEDSKAGGRPRALTKLQHKKLKA